MRHLSIAAACAAILALLPLAARADGEVGVVIQEGGTVETYCIAFKGESITGDQLLTAAGLSFGQFGSGNTRVLCSIDDVGCSAAGDFDSCFCQCKSGGASCTYWAFFTQQYGRGWVYSPIAFTLARSRDGDLQGWKWGSGSPSSAPVPAAASFEQVCGHPPRGGQAVATTTPTADPTPATTTAPTGTTTTSGATASVTLSPTTTNQGIASPTATLDATSTATAAPTVTLSPSLTSLSTARVSSPGPPATGRPGDETGGNDWPLVAFGVVSAGLVTAIAFAAWRRRGHDA